MCQAPDASTAEVAVPAAAADHYLNDARCLLRAGYNIVDVLVGGSQGHVVGIGAILGLRAIGAL
jgi:hypothetical protein